MVDLSRFSLLMSSMRSIDPMRFFSMLNSGVSVTLADTFSPWMERSASMGGSVVAPCCQRLREADRPAALVDDGHARDRAGEVAALLVERRIEPQVCVGMRDVD